MGKDENDLVVDYHQHKDGDGVLTWAIRNDRIDIAHLVLEKISASSIYNEERYSTFSPLLLALKKGNIDIVKLILKKYSSLGLSNWGNYYFNYQNEYSNVLRELAKNEEYKEFINFISKEIFDIKPKKKLYKYDTFAVFEKLNAQINELDNYSLEHKHLQNALISLRDKCCSKIKAELKKKGKNVNERNVTLYVKQSNLKQIIDETVIFMDFFLDPFKSPNEKFKYIYEYEKKALFYKGLKTIGKCLGIIVIAALCGIAGIAFGVGIGLLAGAWTGPGAVVSAFVGLLVGTANAWTLGISVITGLSSVTGAAVASYTFFKPTPLQDAANSVIQQAKHRMREVDNILYTNLNLACKSWIHESTDIDKDRKQLVAVVC